MLLTGVRPEEACGLKWCVIDERNNELIINNAYKDSPIYNENCKVIDIRDNYVYSMGNS